jgi:hypothetical protein
MGTQLIEAITSGGMWTVLPAVAAGTVAVAGAKALGNAAVGAGKAILGSGAPASQGGFSVPAASSGQPSPPQR